MGLDPGFRFVGLAVVALDPLDVIEVAVLETKLVEGMRKSVDNVRRAQEIGRGIVSVLDRLEPPRFIACEAMSFPRSSSVANQLGLCWGLISEIARTYRAPIVQASPQEIKIALCGRKTASKDDVILEIERRFPEIALPKKRSTWEHAADAVGAAVTCIQRERA
jgi:Holliday junction resolvasome RuvABC endonuclease subunit